MSTAPQPLFDMSKATPISQAPLFDMSKAQPIESSPPTTTGVADALQKTTGIAPGPGPLAQAWNQVKAGFSASGAGAGLPKQPTTLGNMAELTGMLGREALQLGIGPGMAEGAGAITEAIPSTTRAGQAFQELKGAIGTHTVAMTDRLANSLGEIKEAADTGSTLPSVINKFVTRIADVDKGPLTYNEARQFYSNVSDLSASERMAAKGKDLRLINEFKRALGETISNTAESGGKLEQYQQAMSEFAKAAKWRDAAQSAKDFAVKTVLPWGVRGAIAGGGGAAAYGLLKNMLGY